MEARLPPGNDFIAAVRRRAYFSWENEGCPEGRHLFHWLKAEEDCLASMLSGIPVLRCLHDMAVGGPVRLAAPGSGHTFRGMLPAGELVSVFHAGGSGFPFAFLVPIERQKYEDLWVSTSLRENRFYMDYQIQLPLREVFPNFEPIAPEEARFVNRPRQA